MEKKVEKLEGFANVSGEEAVNMAGGRDGWNATDLFGGYEAPPMPPPPEPTPQKPTCTCGCSPCRC